jgi:non-homologous end joining protein Ku
MPALMGMRAPAATRITLRPHDPGTGKEIEKREVVKGYEYSRGQFLDAGF